MSYVDRFWPNGDTLSGDKQAELVSFFLNKLADENLNYSQAVFIVDAVKEELQYSSRVRKPSD